MVTALKDTDAKLSQMAARLKLSNLRDKISSLMETAVKAKMTPRETLEYVLGNEIEQREANRIKISLMAAHFPRVCTFENFDMSAQPSLDPGIIRELRKLEWVNAGDNVMFLGPPGVGKTHLSIALGREAIKLSHSVLFLTAANLIQLLEKAIREGTVQQKLTKLAKPKLLIIDELGYTAIRPEVSQLFFQIVCRRYEHKSIVISSNRPVSEWGMVFGDPTLTTAILDRLLHHCTPVTIMGDSYRIKDSIKHKILRKDISTTYPRPTSPTAH